jgi:multicomponent Na+:H+ antiporter subunit B
VNSLILQVAARYLHPLLLLYSLFLLLSGHDAPGGGFAGGLVAASSFALNMIAYGAATTKRALRADPLQWVGLGLMLAIASGAIGVFRSSAFLTGIWIDMPFAIGNLVVLGTPVLFDLGVYLVVLGVSVKLILIFTED